MYENIEKLVEISALGIDSIDSDDNFQTISAVDIVNKHLAEGWKLLAINSYQTSDNTSQVHSYILGFPKSNSSK